MCFMLGSLFNQRHLLGTGKKTEFHQFVYVIFPSTKYYYFWFDSSFMIIHIYDIRQLHEIKASSIQRIYVLEPITILLNLKIHFYS